MSQSEVNYEVVNVRLDLTVRQAEEIRHILFEAHPERINSIREVIQQIDDSFNPTIGA